MAGETEGEREQEAIRLFRQGMEAQGFRGDVLTDEEVMYILERRSAAASSDRLIGRVVNHVLAWKPPPGVSPAEVHLRMDPDRRHVIAAGFRCGERLYRTTRLLDEIEMASLSPDHAGSIMTAQMTITAEEAAREHRPRVTTFERMDRRWTPKPGEPEGPGG